MSPMDCFPKEDIDIAVHMCLGQVVKGELPHACRRVVAKYTSWALNLCTWTFLYIFESRSTYKPDLKLQTVDQGAKEHFQGDSHEMLTYHL